MMCALVEMFPFVDYALLRRMRVYRGGYVYGVWLAFRDHNIVCVEFVMGIYAFVFIQRALQSRTDQESAKRSVAVFHQTMCFCK